MQAFEIQLGNQQSIGAEFAHVAERHRPAGGVFLLRGQACRLANRLATGCSASAISAINLLSIALPNALKVSAKRVLPADDVLAVVGIQTANRVGVVGVLF